MKKIQTSKSNKHSHPPAGKELENQVEKIINNPVGLSRWLALMAGISLVDNHEERWKLGEHDLDQNALVDFVDEKAPDIFFDLSLKGSI